MKGNSPEDNKPFHLFMVRRMIKLVKMKKKTPSKRTKGLRKRIRSAQLARAPSTDLPNAGIYVKIYALRDGTLEMRP